jgi:hypothetical protein
MLERSHFALALMALVTVLPTMASAVDDFCNEAYPKYTPGLAVKRWTFKR